MQHFSIIVLFLIGFSWNLQAQTESFSKDPTELAGQLVKLFERYQQPDVQYELTTFNGLLQSGTLQGKEIEQLSDLFNVMLERKMKPSPVFSKVMASINTLYVMEDADRQAIYPGWYEATYKMAESQKPLKYTKFKEYLNFTDQFFLKEVLYDAGGKTWRVEGGKRKFVWKDDLPKLELEEASLYGANRGDSTYILKTSGLYSIMEEKWNGQNGKVNWLRGQTEHYERAYAILKAYEINMKRPSYQAEDVEFFHDELFDQPLIGFFVDRIQKPANGIYTYPRFYSKDKNLKVADIVPGVEFIGGFGLNGSKVLIVGDTTTAQKAKMIVRDETGAKKFSAGANAFGIKQRNEVNSVDTEVSLYFKNDSIFHPNLELSYDVSTKDLRVARSAKATSQIGFVSSYHKLEAELDVVRWNLNDTMLYMKTASQDRSAPVLVNSWDYYNPDFAQQFKKAIRKDPIHILGNWIESSFSSTISADQFAKQLGGQYQVNDVIPIIFDLVDGGFIYYNTTNQQITIRPKSRLYTMAQMGKIDYDHILILSKTQKDNSFLNLNNGDMTVVGTDFVILSDSQDVRMYPYDKTLTINENRTIKSFGDIVAGRIDLVRGNHQFNYGDFTIDVDTTDKMYFYVDEQEQFRSQTIIKKIQVKTPLERLTGKLTIDDPNNKAGLVRNSQFPYFETTGPSYIFYEKEKLFKKAYSKDRFFFKLDPFKFESIYDIPRENFRFPGTMVFGDIFPEIREEAVLQEDLTIGVDIELEGENLPIYAGIASYRGNVNFSDEGLRGNGQLDHLSATIWSEDYVFLPDSMLTTFGDSLLIRKNNFKGQDYPKVEHNQFNMNWYPYQDSLILTSKKSFRMFEDRSLLKGELNLTSRGLFGKGVVTWGGSRFSSESMTFDQTTLYSDSLDMNILVGERSLVKSETKLKGRIDMYEDNAVFEVAEGQNSEVVRMDLPVHEYSANIDEIIYNYRENTFTFRNKSDKDNYFVSRRKGQKYVRFSAKEAVLDLMSSDLAIEVTGVPEIRVADARIIPEKGMVYLEPDAEIRRLENATIAIDTVKAYHLINNATVDIFSRTDFTGTGEYVYRSSSIGEDQIIQLDLIESREVDPDKFLTEEELKKKKKQEKKEAKEKEATEAKEVKEKEAIEAKELKEAKAKEAKEAKEAKNKKDGKEAKEVTEKEAKEAKEAKAKEAKEAKEAKNKKNKKTFTPTVFYQTFSESELTIEDGFRLDPKTIFKGTVYLESDRKYLLFDGFADITLESPYINTDWFAFKSEVNPNILNIDMNDAVGENGQALKFGMYFDYRNLKPMARFLNEVDTTDLAITPVSGRLSYDSKRNLYRLGDPNRLVGDKKTGNVLAFFDNEEQKFLTEGKMQLANNLGAISLDIGGRAELSLKDSTFNLVEMAIGLDFDIDKKLYQKLIEDLKSLLAEREEVNFLTEGFGRALSAFAGDDEAFAQELNVDLVKAGYYNKPNKKLEYNLFLANVNMIWDDATGSYRSLGDFGLGYAEDTYINRMVKGYIEIAPRSNGDAIFFYVENEDVETGRNVWYFMQYRNNQLQLMSSDVLFNDAVMAIKESKRIIINKKDPDQSYAYGLANMNQVNNFLFRMKEANGEK